MAVWFDYQQEGVINGSVYDAAHNEQKNPLGKKVRIGPREFVYVQGSSSLVAVAGELLSPPAPQAMTSNALAVAEAGSMELALTLSVTIKDQFAGGYIFIAGGTGAGYTFAIETHEAHVGGVTTFELRDPLKVAVDATTDVFLAPNPYNGVNQASVDEEVIGVAHVATTASQYFWVQTKGPACVTIDDIGSLDRGDLAGIGAGGVITPSADIVQTLGPLITAPGAERQPVWLDIPTYS